MIINLERLEGQSAQRCEICVIGGGAVGLAMAVQLSMRGADVLVLEGGGPTLENESQALQRGESVGHPFPNIDVGRYRVLGGTTTFWGGQVFPFDRFVTSGRAWAGHDAWPIEPGELDRYFLCAYQLLGLSGAERVDDEVWSRLGVKLPEMGEQLEMVMTRWVRTRNFARMFSKTLRSPGGPRVLTHANVVAIRLREGRCGVESVVARSLSGKSIEVTARHFVLANGTLEIARLLMHPLADGTIAPWAASRYLGRPLVDHLDCIAGDVDILDHARFRQLFDNIYLGGYKYYPKLRLSPRIQQAEGLVDIGAQFMYKTRFSEHLDYLKMFLRSIAEGGVNAPIRALPKHLAAVAATTVPLAVRYFKDRRSFKPRDAKVNLTLFCEQLPTAKSQLSLSDVTDELGLRRLRVDWQIDGRELATMRRFGLLIKEWLERNSLASVKLDPLLLTLDRAFIANVHDGIHQMGTTRMGRTAAEGFVDADLKVFGIDNLFIAGAAVFPSSGFVNPTFTAIALALRLADRLTKVSR